LKQVLILAGIHGNETAGVSYVAQLIQGLTRPPGPPTTYDMDVIPIVNPWGYVHNLPFNCNGVDIGLDFTDFDSHEARVVRRFLRDKRYDLVLDLREDPEADGFCIWQYGLDDAGASGRMVSRVQAAGYPIAHDTTMMFLKPRNGIVEAPMWGLTFLRLSRRLTVAGYIRRNVSNVVFTVVTPATLPLEDRIAMQRIAVETLLDEYATTR
jgi:predicted deacylase